MEILVRCLALVLLTCPQITVANFFGDAYYNNRYGADGIAYVTGKKVNKGLFLWWHSH